MPQMSKLPFVMVSLVLFVFFLVWVVKVWFSSGNSSLVGDKYRNGGNNWPM